MAKSVGGKKLAAATSKPKKADLVIMIGMKKPRGGSIGRPGADYIRGKPNRAGKGLSVGPRG